METWKSVKGFEGLYEISNQGRLRNKKGNTIKPADNGKGYLRFNLSHGKRNYSTKYLHRIIAEAFIPNPDGLPEVNHIDENKRNNAISNLEWSSVLANRLHGTSIKRSSEKKKKEIIAKSSCGIEVIRFKSATDAIKHGYSNTAINNCLSGRSKTHKGLTWFYAS